MPNILFVTIYTCVAIILFIAYYSRHVKERYKPLIFVLLALQIFGGILVIGSRVQYQFDKKFLTGEIEIQTEMIPLGHSGEPSRRVLPEDIPIGGSGLVDIPRQYEVSGCRSYETPEDALGVFAITENVHQITVYSPVQSGGPTTVCVNEGTASVVLWVALSN